MRRSLFRALIVGAGLLVASLSLSAQESVFSGGKYNPPLTITYGRVLSANVKFKAGEDVNNNVFTKWALDRFGIKFVNVWTVPNNDAYNTKIRLLMAAGEPLPDLLRVGDTTILAELIEAKKVRDVTDELNKFLSARQKDIYFKYPEAMYQLAKKGRYYGLPVLTSANVSDELMWIRQDWLDKVGMKAPTTIAELEKVMDAFMAKDPGGNGAGKTLGVTLGSKNALVNWRGSAGFLVGSFGGLKASDKGWGFAADGKMAYKAIQPEMKQVLAKLADWVKKGYVDPQFLLMDESKCMESIDQGKSGIVFGPPWMASFAPLMKLQPEANFQPYPVPLGANGAGGRSGEGMIQGNIVFNPNFKGVEGYLKLVDKLQGTFITMKDPEFELGWFAGYDYQVTAEGKLDTDPTRNLDNVNVSQYVPGLENAPVIPFKEYEVQSYLWNGGKPRNVAEEVVLKAAEANNRKGLHGAAIIIDQTKYNITNNFTGAPTPTQIKKSEYLMKLQDDTFAKIIYGAGNATSFDEFVKQWKAGGGDAWTAEVNDWYKSVSGK